MLVAVPFVMPFIDHVQLAMPRGAEDIAREFYSRLLGLEEAAKPTVLAARGGVWFHLGDLQLHLGVEEPFAPARKAHPGIAWEDLDSLAARIERAGFDPVWDENLLGRRRFYVHDPFGNRLEFLEPG